MQLAYIYIPTSRYDDVLKLSSLAALAVSPSALLLASLSPYTMFNRLLSVFLLVASLLALVQCEQLDGFPYRREVTVMPEAFRSMNHLTRRDTCAGVTCPSGYRKVSYKAATEKVCNCIVSTLADLQVIDFSNV